MSSINGLTTRLYSISADKVSSQAVTPAKVFSRMNARSCEQRLQTSLENRASFQPLSTPLQPDAIKNKLSGSNSLTFPAAQAAPIFSKKTPMGVQTQEKYDDWRKKGNEKTESLNRQKLVLEKGKITLEQIIKVGFEKYLGIGTEPAFQNLRNILSKDSSLWSNHKNADAERFKVIKAAIMAILKNPKYAETMLEFINQSIGAFQISALENNEDFRRAYMFIMHENEKSISARGKFFYHTDVEELFPASYQAYDQGIDYFQQIPVEESDTDNNRINIYALLLHHQSAGKPLNYKSLAMAFAHIDILNYGFKGITFLQRDKEAYDQWLETAKKTGSFLQKVPAIKQYFANKNLEVATNLIFPCGSSQYLNLARFVTSNTKLIKGVCHYITMSVMIALHKRNLDAVESTLEMLDNFHNLIASDPIIYFRAAHLLESANIELLKAYGTIPSSPTPVIAGSRYQLLTDNSKLADVILREKQFGFNILVRNDFGHSVGVVPVKIENEIIHYYFDPNFGLVPCFCREHLEEAIRMTFREVEVKDVKDSNEINKLVIHLSKLNRVHLNFFANLQTDAGFKFNKLNKQHLSKFANSHSLSNEDWSAFFPDFNKGEKLYNKGFDSLEGDPVYKALKTDTTLKATAMLYLEALHDLSENPFDPNVISSATISDALERERLSAATDQNPYHDAMQALEAELKNNQAASLPFASSQDNIPNKNRSSVSLDDLFDGTPSEHTSTQNLSSSVFNPNSPSKETRANQANRANCATSQPSGGGFASRVRNVLTGCFGHTKSEV